MGYTHICHLQELPQSTAVYRYDWLLLRLDSKVNHFIADLDIPRDFERLEVQIPRESHVQALLICPSQKNGVLSSALKPKSRSSIDAEPPSWKPPSHAAFASLMAWLKSACAAAVTTGLDCREFFSRGNP